MKAVTHILTLLKQLPRIRSGIGSFGKAREIQNRIYELSPEEFTHLVYLVIPDQMDAIISSKAAKGLEADRDSWQWWIVAEKDFGYAWHTRVKIATYEYTIYGEC